MQVLQIMVPKVTVTTKIILFCIVNLHALSDCRQVPLLTLISGFLTSIKIFGVFPFLINAHALKYLLASHTL